MKIRLVLPTASLLLLSGVFLPVTSFGAELKPIVSPETMAKKLIERGDIEGWITIGKVDIDRDGDLDKVMTSDYSDSRGNSLWRVYFNEGGEFFYTKGGVFFRKVRNDGSW